jgi:hypothetical protein
MICDSPVPRGIVGQAPVAVSARTWAGWKSRSAVHRHVDFAT